MPNLILLIGFMFLPVVAVIAWIAVTEIIERAWQRGYDTAWERAADASKHGIRII